MSIILSDFNSDALKMEIVNGGASATNIAIADIVTDDVLLEVISHASTGTPVTDLTSVCSITADGYIQTATGTASQTGNKLVVRWMQKRPSA